MKKVTHPKLGKLVIESDDDYRIDKYDSEDIEYNNKTLIKHDIESGKLAVVRRLLREGNIGILNKENQELLAKSIDNAIECIQVKKKKGRPKIDEFENLIFERRIYKTFEYLRHVIKMKREKALEVVSKKSDEIDRFIQEKRVEQIVDNYKKYEKNYDLRLFELCFEEASNIEQRYYEITHNIDKQEMKTRLLTSKPILIKKPKSPETPISKELHEEVVGKLAKEFKMSEKEIQERLERQNELCPSMLKETPK